MKNTSIVVMNREQLEGLKGITSTNNKVSIICVSDCNQSFPRLTEELSGGIEMSLFMHFNDVLGNEEKHMSDTQANLVNAMVDQLRDTDSTLIISCTGGVSRSPAIKAAILLRLFGDDSEVWEDGHVCPNRFVYEKLLQVMFTPDELKDIDIDSKESINIAAWKKVNDIE